MIKTTERGWAGHYCLAHKCRFRRNTLIENESTKIVVSTVGNMFINGKLEEIGASGRLYETMAFHSKCDKYDDADVSREVSFGTKLALYEHDDIKANEMHEAVVEEFIAKLEGR